MSVLVTYPGVYLQELPSGVRSIVGVSTSLTAFIGRALRGPVNVPTAIGSYADFNRIFGGLWAPSALGYSVAQFFNNGGSQALIVRVHNGATPATATLPGGSIALSAANPGTWGSKLSAAVTAVTPTSTTTFNLTLTDSSTVPTTGSPTTETYFNLSVDPASPKFVGQVLAQQSQLAFTTTTFTSPAFVAIPTAGTVAFGGGSPSDGTDISDAQVSAASLTSRPAGRHRNLQGAGAAL